MKFTDMQGLLDLAWQGSTVTPKESICHEQARLLSHFPCLYIRVCCSIILMKEISAVITSELQKILEDEYQLNWHGIHGYSHWMRVRENGLRLAKINGANPDVIELFAFLHDICRRREGTEPEHGKRAAAFINTLAVKTISLPEADLDSLKFACAYHDQGLVDGNITVQTCWDADRLDLGRVGTYPDPRFLCTEAAKQPAIIAWAYRRSRNK